MRQKRYNKHENRRAPARRVAFSSSKASAAGGKVYIYGKHALAEALRNAPRVIRKVFLAPDLRLSAGRQDDAELRALLEKNKIPTTPLAKGSGKGLVGKDAVHQGVIVVMDPASLLVTLDDFLAAIPKTGSPIGSPKIAVAVLAEVQDPHNVGAIIRSAAAFGLAGVLIPEHHQAGVTGAVVKASAGMAFRIPLVSIGNVNAALKTLKAKGFWIYGLSASGDSALGSDAFDAPCAFVVGNEGSGIREKTLDTCDVMLSIPIHARTESLNAAVSAAVVFYEWSRKHPEAL